LFLYWFFKTVSIADLSLRYLSIVTSAAINFGEYREKHSINKLNKEICEMIHGGKRIFKVKRRRKWTNTLLLQFINISLKTEMLFCT